MSRWRAFREDRSAFARYLLALLLPGHLPSPLGDGGAPAGTLRHYADDDLTLVIEEGRRHHDRLHAELDAVRARAQLGFTTGLALNVVIGSQLAAVVHRQPWILAVYALGWLLAAVGMVGALAVFVAPARMQTIHAGLLSTYDPPLRRSLAADYAALVGEMEPVLSTLRTVLAEAMLYLVLGAAADGAVWLAVHV